MGAARTPHEKTSLERQIAATDTQIDGLIYDLYGLTEDEITVVEGKAIPELEPSHESLTGIEAAKPARARAAKAAYADPPPAPADPSLTPEKAYGDSAHYYSAEEEAPPYSINSPDQIANNETSAAD